MSVASGVMLVRIIHGDSEIGKMSLSLAPSITIPNLCITKYERCCR
jgi:hypothetical protein